MIPFCKTTLGKEESEAVRQVIESGWVVLGPRSAEFEKKFAEYVGSEDAVFVDSGTAALFLSLKYVYGVGGAILAVPSLTFCATAEVIVNTGNIPHFKDVSLDDFCLEDISPVSLPVHLLGNKAKGGAAIYDSAHRIEKDDLAGSDALSCFSFYATKNMTTVQGGMIACSRVKAEWLRKARDHGLNLGTKERYEGKYKQYEVEFVGWRVKGDDLRAAVGLEQLKKLPAATLRRNEIVGRYNENLGFKGASKRVGNHVFPILVKDREHFMEYMFDKEIQCTVHFRPLHLMPAYRDYPRGKMKNTEFIGEHIVSIPLHPALTNDEVDYISDTIKKSKALLQ